jgi:16S rRNA (cytidine1402-2'-O)-methyltransferase
MSKLYLVATPIGNLEDMSPRAIRILREVHLVAAEDTRQTRKLLNRYDIHTPLTSYYEHNKLSKMEVILSALDRGDVALVADAGTPTINDPGQELVAAILDAGHDVSPIPGPSSPIAALAASGLPTDTFLYLGYLPRKSTQRRAMVEGVSDLKHTLVILEAPHRLLEALADLESVLGDRRLSISRELTKIHEQIWHGTISEARRYFGECEPRGEFTLVVAGKGEESKTKWSEAEVDAEIKRLSEEGESPSALARRIASKSGWNRRDVYDLIKGK